MPPRRAPASIVPHSTSKPSGNGRLFGTESQRRYSSRSRPGMGMREDFATKTYRMAQAGVRMAAGSDSPWGWYAPGEFVHEVSMLVEAGLSCRDAIVAATSGAADSIGAGKVSGRLEVGRLADVLVAAGDPTQDIRALWNVLDVYQAGVKIQRAVR